MDHTARFRELAATVTKGRAEIAVLDGEVVFDEKLVSRFHLLGDDDMAIVRYLVELHPRTVTAEGPGEGRGATFRIRLPVQAES